MINLGTMFWLLIIFFAVIGSLRGWTREVVATAGLILSLFALNQFGPTLVAFLGAPGDPAVPVSTDAARQRFYILSVIHLLIAFFSYQGPALAGSRLADRLRIRDSLQDKVLGAIIGALNGYLIVGTVWAFLEMNLAPDGNYPFSPAIMTRPGFAGTPAVSLVENLPLPLLAPYLPVLVVIVFLFVIVVMI